MHPRHGVEKTYEATVVGAVTEETARKLADGVDLDGPAPRRPAYACCEPPDGRA